MNKVYFLDLYQPARDGVANVKNVQHEWTKSGLLPLNLILVILKLPKERLITPLEITFKDSNGISTTISITISNVVEVDNILQKYRGGNIDPAIVEKLGKAASRALARGQLLDITNHELLEANKRKQRKAARTNEHWGEAQIMTLEIVRERKQQYAAKQTAKENRQKDRDWARETKGLNRIGPDLFEDKKTKGKGSTKKSIPIQKEIHRDHERFQDVDDFLNFEEFLSLGEPRSQEPRSPKPRGQEPQSQKPRSQEPRSQEPRSQEPRSQGPSEVEIVKETTTFSPR